MCARTRNYTYNTTYGGGGRAAKRRGIIALGALGAPQKDATVLLM